MKDTKDNRKALKQALTKELKAAQSAGLFHLRVMVGPAGGPYRIDQEMIVTQRTPLKPIINVMMHLALTEAQPDIEGFHYEWYPIQLDS